MKIIDVHTHIFPDNIAAKATRATAEYFPMPEPPNHSGTAGELLEVMERTEICYAMVFSAATNPNQVEHINRFIYSQAQAHPRFLPCGTLHAGFSGFRDELRWMREHGMFGVKIHPEFQRFTLDDERLFPMYEEMERYDMFLIAHMGDPRVDLSGPHRMLPVARTFPKLRCIAAHLGNWGDWDIEKIRPLTRIPNIYTDISSTFSYAPDKTPLFPILREYEPSHIFWGSDYPIWCPQKEIAKTMKLGLEEAFLQNIFFHNFAAFYHYRKL